MTTFKQKVIMKVTSEKYKKDLEAPLLAMGYEWNSSYGIKKDLDGEYPYLSNDYGPENGKLGGLNNHSVSFEEYYLIDHYNPELYLALAAMTEGNDWIAGEWFYCHTQLKMEISDRIEGIPGKLYKCEEASCITDESGIKSHFYSLSGSDDYKRWFRKATLQEILKHFNQKQMKEQKIIRYDSKPEFEEALIKMFGRATFGFVPGSVAYDEAVRYNVLDIMFTPVYEEEEKVFKVGNFEIKVRNGKAYHKTDDITIFVKGLCGHFNEGEFLFGGFKAIVKDVSFSKTGCEHTESKLSEWIEVYKELKK